MSKLFILALIIPLSVFGQSSRLPNKAELTGIYTRAIGDFIRAAREKNHASFDTLFFEKGAAGQQNSFPDIQLPQIIEHTHIRLVTAEAGAKSQKERKSRIYINLPAWVDKERAEFIFVVFSNGFEHQYDYHISYRYNKARKEFELVKLELKGPPFDK